MWISPLPSGVGSYAKTINKRSKVQNSKCCANETGQLNPRTKDVVGLCLAGESLRRRDERGHQDPPAFFKSSGHWRFFFWFLGAGDCHGVPFGSYLVIKLRSLEETRAEPVQVHEHDRGGEGYRDEQGVVGCSCHLIGRYYAVIVVCCQKLHQGHG